MLPYTYTHNSEDTMNKTPVSTKNAPAAIGPYSQGMVAGGFVFTAGQLPINPVTGEVSGDIAAQTRQCMDNIKAILEAAGSGMDKTLKFSLFLTDLADFSVVNEIYAQYFSGTYPARSTVEVSGLAKGARIEIEAVGLV